MRAWRRGTREMDLVLGSFADRHIEALDAEGMAAFEALLEVPDGVLLSWITGERAPPEHHDTALFGRIRAGLGSLQDG